MKIIVVGNYPPRQCGIATFTQNLTNAIQSANNIQAKERVEIEIAAMNDGMAYDYPPEVRLEIQQDRLSDYNRAAQYINRRANVCVLQHEYGIFGGECGSHLLHLVEQLQVPLVVTLHTVLKQPSVLQTQIVQKIARKAYRLVVMSEKARQFLIEIYNIPGHKIGIIEHGVPDFDIPNRTEARRKISFEKQQLLFTFGLLGRGKGIETVIRALPKVVEKHPEVRYLLLGKTHPNVIRHEGEAYRESLVAMAESLGVADNLLMRDDFVSDRELLDYLVAADAYIIPYLQEAQITSGTLSYAVGAGAMVVSTPFWHAQELLADERGVHFDFGNAEQLSEKLLQLLDHPDQMKQHRKNAAAYGKTLKWREKGTEYLSLFVEAIQKHSIVKTNGTKRPAFRLPAANFQHLQRLTDSTGILQHAKYSIPNFHEGYCLDDNARTLLVACMAMRQGHREVKTLIPNYLGYLYYMQRPDGLFKNFLSYDRRFLDEVGTEDAFGRTIWALGYALAYPPEQASTLLVREMFDRAFQNIAPLKAPRAQAYCILGLSHYLEAHPNEEHIRTTIQQLTDHLVRLYHCCTDENWQWFEESLTYNNALLPLALFRSLVHRNDPAVRKVAETATQFLEKLTLSEGYLRPIGCHSFYKKGSTPCYFDQQPIDSMAMVLLCRAAYEVTQEEHYFEKAILCHRWFLGANDLQLPMYNPKNGGCYDGLMEHGVNQNQGAESTLAYWLSHLTVAELLQQRKPETAAKPDAKIKHLSQRQTDGEGMQVLPSSANVSVALKSQ
jgi:glycosyltransferase involved in cell wall biosynthesis